MALPMKIFFHIEDDVDGDDNQKKCVSETRYHYLLSNIIVAHKNNILMTM